MSKALRNIVWDLTLIVVFLATLVLLINPTHFWMPSSVQMILLAVFAAAFAIFIVVFWKESAVDERDRVHMMFAGRVAFIVGSSLLAIGTIVQSLQHNLDSWLPGILFCMVISKYLGRVYAQYHK